MEEITRDDLPEMYRLSYEEQSLIQIYRSLEKNDRMVLLRMYDMFLKSRKK